MTVKTETSVKIAAATPQFTGGQPFDLCALADAKLELNITDTLNDAWLSAVITRVSASISKFCNRTFAVQTYEDRVWPQMDPYPWQLPGGLSELKLSSWPVTSPVSPAGTPAPLAPVLSMVAGGALAATPYFIRITYVTPNGETACSLEATLRAPANTLLQITSPNPDANAIATGWNVYAGTSSFSGTLQNASPIAIGTGWTLPASGLIAGGAAPAYASIVENAVNPLSPLSGPLANQNPATVPLPLADGIDFATDQTDGKVIRLSSGLTPIAWLRPPIVAQYQAGFASIPADLQEAAIRMVKMRWFGRNRDPLVRQDNVEGVYSATYWFGTGPGGEPDFPADIGAMLERNYRVPVIA